MNETQQEDDAQALAKDDKTMKFTYGFPGWTSPDFGTAMDLSNKPDSASESAINTLGANGYDQNGDLVGNDARVTHGTSYPNSGQDAVQFLNTYVSNDNKKPFFLVVSLLNPHDVWVYPENLEEAGWVRDSNGKYPWQYSPFTDITLPHSFDLTTEQINNKPSIQGTPWRTDWEPDKATGYVRFYAFLETLTDKLFGEVCEALEKNSSVEKNTLVIRIADHGEMAMAQGGMREKEHQAYNETLLVPMIFSNPGLNTGTTCTGLAGLIDIIPTIADIVGIDLEKLKSKHPIQGRSLADAILNAGASSALTHNTHHKFLFATDDANAHIRCLIDDNCVIDDKIYKAKYAVYYNAVIGGNPNGTITGGMQFEMYKFSYTPGIPGSKTKSTPTPPRWDSEETNLLPLSGTTSKFINGFFPVFS